MLILPFGPFNTNFTSDLAEATLPFLSRAIANEFPITDLWGHLCGLLERLMEIETGVLDCHGLLVVFGLLRLYSKFRPDFG